MSDRSLEQNRVVLIGIILLLAALITSILLLAFVPPISRDALIHHLAIPKLYIQHGGIYEIPDLMFSYYPMNVDLLYMWALYLGNDILPKYIHMFFGFATALLLFHYIGKRLPAKYAYLGALFFLSIPIIIRLSITAYVDLGLVFFSTASVLLILHWIEDQYRSRYLILAGICCGLAVGTKYNGLVVLFLLTLFIPILRIRTASEGQNAARDSIQASILFFFSALIIASPWFIRNMIWTGNPVYPLYDSFFNPVTASTIDSAASGDGIGGIFATRITLYGENIWQVLLLPIRIFFQGIDDDPRFFDGRLNPFLLLLPLLAFIRIPLQRKYVRIERTTLLWFCLLFFFFAFHTSVLRIRYLTPMIPGLVILSMFGLHNAELLLKQFLKKAHSVAMAWSLVVVLMLSLNAVYLFQQFHVVEPLSVISGRVNRDDYIARYRPEYKMMQYANTQLPDSSKILCIFLGWKGYYLDRKHVFDHHSNTQLLLAWLVEPDMTLGKIINHLENNNISHLLIRTDLLLQWLQNIPPSSQALWNKLFGEHLLPLSSHMNYSLFEITP